jgi:nitrate/nitrite transporter NarK
MGEIVQDILRDVQEVIRAELRLARAEMTEKARSAGKAGGMFGGAAVAGLLAACCLVTACVAALALAMPVWAAALIMTVLLGAAAGMAYTAGRSKLKTVTPVPEQTVQTLKDDVEWAKNRTK